MESNSILARVQTAVGFWATLRAKVMQDIPSDVQRRLAVAKAAHSIANQLAPLEPDANREILRQAAEILGVGDERKEA